MKAGLALVACASASGALQAAFQFDAVTLSTYMPSPGMGSGVAVADFDGDGHPDIFVPTGGGTPNLLFRNRGDGTFDEVAAEFGLADNRQARSALWVDYDGDGDLDLFVTRDCAASDLEGNSEAVMTAIGACSVPVLSLLEQSPKGFFDISADMGLVESAESMGKPYHAGGLSAADVNDDGLPDIYFARWETFAELYISELSSKEGSTAPGYLRGSAVTDIAERQAGYWQALMHDFNGDGLIDLFVNVDFTANQFWINGEGLQLVEAAPEAGVDSAWNEMGLAGGDYDNDGDIDVFVTNIYDWQGQNSHNLLYRNDSMNGAVGFTEMGVAAGVGDTGWGWGAVWLDADNDGDLDLAVTNGYCQFDFCSPDPSKFFDNPGNGDPFLEIGGAVGFDDMLDGGGLVAADFDGDGRMDLLQTAIDPETASLPLERRSRLTIYYNRAADQEKSASFVMVKPRIDGSNSHALGTVVRLFLEDGQILTRLVTAGESWMSQNPATLHFGLGNSADIVRMEIDWAGDPADSILEDVTPNSVMTVVGPESIFSSLFE